MKQIKKISMKTWIIIALALLNITLFMTPSLYMKEIFKKPSITGLLTISTTANIPGIEGNTSCNFTLKKGWNLVAFNCFLTDNSIKNVLTSIDGKYAALFTYLPNYDDKWKSYNPNLPNWVVQDLDNNLSRKLGYWIDMTNDANYSLNGTMRSQDFIDVSAGWNLVANPTNKTYNVSHGLQSIDGKYNIVYGYDATNQTWKAYKVNVVNASGLNNLTPFRAYWVNMSDDGSIWLWDI